MKQEGGKVGGNEGDREELPDAKSGISRGRHTPVSATTVVIVRNESSREPPATSEPAAAIETKKRE